jgi:ribonuclease I
MNALSLSLLCSVACLAFGDVDYCYNSGCNQTPCINRNYTHYKLAQQHPQGWNYVKPCTYYKVNSSAPSWSLHGLWPSHDSDNTFKDYLRCCNTTAYFDEEKIKELLPDMRLHWMSFTNNSNEKFWAHEWCSHGTCALEFETESSYFEKGVYLFKKYNLFDILRNSRIVPSDTEQYQCSAITQAIVSALNAYPIINCDDNHNDTCELLSICLCFSRENFTLVDCPNNYDIKSCRSDQPLIYRATANNNCHQRS